LLSAGCDLRLLKIFRRWGLQWIAMHVVYDNVKQVSKAT
jgi:hypothetical protein